jgi:N-acetylglucosamine-6-phosphate deacetylase
MMIAIRAGQILTPLQSISPGILFVEARIIKEVTEDQYRDLSGFEVIDASDQIVAPGLIDLHTHGIAGMQGVDGNPEDYARMSEHYARHGVTSFLATICGSQEAIEAGIRAVLESKVEGAEIIGIHMEGPFINPARKGAFALETIVQPDINLLEHYLHAAQGAIRLITLAPELEHALDLVRYARQAGVVCSAGHTQATWDQMMAAIEAGVSHVTHTYNGMAPLNHRDPGILGAALVDDRLTVEIIADGIHVHPMALKLLLRCKPAGRVVVISDSIGAAGLPDGIYTFEGLEVTIADHSARLKDGTLAGSVTTLEKELVNLVRLVGLPLDHALRIASLNPATEVGIQGRKGQLAAGMDADLICLDRESLALQWTMARGRRFKPE